MQRHCRRRLSCGCACMDADIGDRLQSCRSMSRCVLSARARNSRQIPPRPLLKRMCSGVQGIQGLKKTAIVDVVLAVAVLWGTMSVTRRRGQEGRW